MAIELNHTIVPAHDKNASAEWFAELFGLPVSEPLGPFAVVKVGSVSLDFADRDRFESHHYAFLVGDEDFDHILRRVKERGLTYAADPMYRKPGEINRRAGGRGVYFHDRNGHNLEILTRVAEAR